MEIRKLRIGSFGKLNNVELDLCGGLNLVEGDNECGKSTIHYFIRAMLFGVDVRRGNAYDRFLPWDNPGSFQGSLDFEHDGRNYRIRRSFLKTERSCVFSDADTGKVLRGVNTITDIIPELTESAYRNTVAPEQCDSRPEADFSKHVGDRIANLAAAKSTEINVSGAAQELQKKAKELKKRLQGDEKKELEKELADLLEMSGETDACYERQTRIKAKIQDCDSRTEKLLSRKEDCRQICGKVNSIIGDLKKNREQRWQEQLEEEKRQQEKLLEQGRKQLELEREQQKKLLERERQNQKKQLEEEINNGRVEEIKQKRSRLVLELSLGAILAGALCTFLFTDSSQIGVFIAAVLLMAGAIGLVASLVMTRERKLLNGNVTERAAEADSVNGEMLEPDGEPVQPLKESGSGYEAAAESADIMDPEEQDGAQSVIESDGSDELVRLTDELQVLNGNLEQIEDKLREISEERHEYEKQLAAVEAKLEVLRDPVDRIDEIRTRLEECDERKTGDEKELEAVMLALDAINGLSDKIYRSFGEKLNRNLSETVERVTDGRYRQTVLRQDLKPLCMDKLDYVAADALSTGTAEQIYFALRVTLAEVFFDNLKVPLILDEPFAYYDECRQRKALELLAESERQVILFTCRSLEGSVLDQMGVMYRRFSM